MWTTTWNENGSRWVYQCWRHSQLDEMRDEDNNGGITTNGNEDREQNHQLWKHSQPDQTRSVNEEDCQKVYCNIMVTGPIDHESHVIPSHDPQSHLR